MRKVGLCCLVMAFVTLACLSAAAQEVGSGRVVLKFGEPLQVGGASARKVQVRALAAGDLPVCVSGQELSVSPGFYPAGRGVAVFKDGISVGLGRVGPEGLHLSLSTQVPEQQVLDLVDGDLLQVMQAAAGSYHSLALLSGGWVLAWGRNSNGQLGDGTTADRHQPTLVKDPGGSGYLTGVVAAAGGGDRSIALLWDGRVLVWGWMWGSRWTLPRQVALSLPEGVRVAQVAAGGRHLLLLLSDGRVMAWGTNTYGQLGDGTTTTRYSPVYVKGPGGSGYLTGAVQVVGGNEHSLALLSDGRVVAWGHNHLGQLGIGTSSSGDYRVYPVYVRNPSGTADLTGVTSLAAGCDHNLALLSDGRVLSWGRNDYGQLGLNSVQNRSLPAYVLGVGGSGHLGQAQRVLQVGCGFGHSLALLAGGRVVAWGGNYNGQLGTGDTSNRLYPVYMQGVGTDLPVAAALAVGGLSGHSLVLLSDGRIVACGYNAQGQVGDGTTQNRLCPTPVINLP